MSLKFRQGGQWIDGPENLQWKENGEWKQNEEEVYLAQDNDFLKRDGHWVYIGEMTSIEIPHTIRNEEITSYNYMFSEQYNATAPTKVRSANDNIITSAGMFRNSQITKLDLSEFETSSITNMFRMFEGIKAPVLDLSNFDMSNVTTTSYMFRHVTTTVGYARTMADATKLNASSTKPQQLWFTVK